MKKNSSNEYSLNEKTNSSANEQKLVQMRKKYFQGKWHKNSLNEQEIIS